MRPIFNPSARVRVACPSRVGVGTLGALIKSGLLDAFFADTPRASLPFATADAAVGSSLRGDGSGFVSTGGSDSYGLLAATATGGVSSLVAFAFSSVSGGLAGLAAFRTCGVAYKSITSREGLLSREAV